MADNFNGATTAVFAITLSTTINKPISVKWQTEDGTGKAGLDYIAANGTVEFLPGETEKQIQVTVFGRSPDSGAADRMFYIKLFPPSDAILANTLTECTIKVTDDEGTPVTELIVAQGKRGQKGDPGLSAYEQAVNMGFTGTLQDWMNEIADASQAADRAQVSASRAEAAATSASFLGNIYPTPEAGVDPVTGVPNGAYYNVRSAQDDDYIEEYRNVSGVPTSTGKAYPSSQAVLYELNGTITPSTSAAWGAVPQVKKLTGAVSVELNAQSKVLLQMLNDVRKNGGAMPYSPEFAALIGGFDVGDQVKLNNGKIVISEIDNNQNNPNVDFTGWSFKQDQLIKIKNDDYYETSLEFGDESKATLDVKNNGVLSISVTRGDVLIAKNVTLPYVSNMANRSINNVPFKRLLVPSAGFEDSNQSGSLVFGYKGTKQKLALLNVNDLIPFDPEFSETENQTTILTLLDFPYQVVQLPENNDYLPKYLKIAEIPARSDYSLFSCEFFGGWNNERLSGRTIFNFSNYGNINWDAAPSYTSKEWQSFIKIIAEGSQGNRMNLKALNFAVKYENNKLSIYAILPPYSFYTALLICKKNAISFLKLDAMSFSDGSSLIQIYRGLSLNTYNSGIASDGTVVMCDAHIRIARSANQSDTSRELSSNGYHWIGSGTTNLPHYSNVTIEKIATGTYRLNNVPGLWNSEVRLRQPYDLDGNQVAIATINDTTPIIYVYEIKYTVQAGGTNVIKEKGNLIDIPSNAWVDVFYSENWS